MQDGFADLFRMEVPPDDLLANGFSDEMFDMEDYLNELLPDNIDSELPNEGTASASEQAQPDLFPEAAVGELGTSWDIGTIEQSFSEVAAPSRLSGPVITTGALPVATEQPPTFFSQLPAQPHTAWPDFPAPQEQLQAPGSTAQLHGNHQFAQQAQAQPAVRSPEAVLQQLEEMLQADNSPEVQERLLAIIAAQGKSAGRPGPLPPQQAPPSIAAANVPAAYHPGPRPASAAYASTLAGSYQAQTNTLDSRQAQQERLGSFEQLQAPAPGQFRHPTAADRLQPQLLPRGVEPYAWPATTQAAGRLPHPQQPHQFVQRPLLPQQLPSTQMADSIPPQERLRKPGPQPAPGRRGVQSQPQVRPTGAVSLQQQLQALLPRQEEQEPLEMCPYLPSSTSSAAFPHSLSHDAGPPIPSTLPQGLGSPWQAPTAPLTYRPDLQRNSTGSSSPLNALTAPFDSAAGSQPLTQALLEPLAFNPLPVDTAAAPFDPPFQHGSASQSAAQQVLPALSAAAARLGSPPAPLSTEVPSLMQAATTSAAGRQPPSVLDPRLVRPTAPHRAPPPPASRAAGLRQFQPDPAAMADAAAAAAAAAAASRAGIHSSPQATSDRSSGASCGLAASAAQAFQYPPGAPQGAAILPSVPPVSGDMGMSLPALQPAAVAAAYQDSVLDQADGDEGGLLQAQTDATHGQAHGQQEDTPSETGAVELNAQGKPKRKRKRDTHQQELNKQAQHRYRERKKAKVAELAQQVQLLSTKAANLQSAKVKQAHLREHNEALRKALEMKKAELAAAVAAARHSSSPPEAHPAEDSLADKVSAMERRASSLAEQLHYKVFELSRHLKQFGLDNKENVPWDGGRANPAVLEVIRNLVHDIHIITHEAHKMEGPDVWDVVHRVVAPRQCAPGCHCLHCKDKDAWLDVAEALKLNHEQKCKIIVSRDHTNETLRQVYEKRRALNLEAVHLMLPQSQGNRQGSNDGLKEFAEMAFFSRARNTGKMSEVVDKLKANLREEAYAKTKLDYSMFTKILSPVQSAWFITEAYPLKFDCQALASAVCHIWGQLCAAPAVRPPQPHQLHQQPATRQQLTQLLQQQQLQLQQQQQQQPAVLQMRSVSPARRLEAAQAAAMRHEAPSASVGPLQASQPGAVRQPSLMRSHPGPANLSAVPLQQQFSAAQVPLHTTQSRALQSLQQVPAAQRAQRAQRAQQRPVHTEQAPVAQRAQHAQEAHAPGQLPAAQRVQQLQSLLTMAQPSVTQQAAQPSLSSLSLQQQVEEMENRQRRQFLQQRLGVPPAHVMPGGQDLRGMRSSSLNSILSGQRFMGLGALQGADPVLAGAVPRPTGARLPMAVP